VPLEIRQAGTEAEREAIFRLRYEIYVVDQRLFVEQADHDRKLLSDADDVGARLFYAESDGEVIGTMRLSWGGDGPFSPALVAPYDLARFGGVVEPKDAIVLTRFMVRADRRGGATALALIAAVTRFAHEVRAELLFCDCQPHLLRLYTAFGFRTYKPTFNDPVFGLMVPLVLVPSDVEYLRAIQSPALGMVPAEEIELRPEFAARILARISDRPPLVRREDSTPEAFFAELGGAVEPESLGVFDGIALEDRDRLVAQSHILECEPGDVVIRAGQTTRTLYVVLRGALEVVEEGALVAVASEGQVVGEVAFLMGGRRMSDVRVAAQGARVLALSDATLRRLIEHDAPLAAKLLHNLARTVCAKLQERSTLGARSAPRD